MLEWQNESSLFTIRIQGKQWYWAYKYNSDTNYRLQNVFINVGNNNWYKTVNASNVYFNTQNSILAFIYDYEFKKNHRNSLDSAYKNKSGLNLLTLNSGVSTSSAFLSNKVKENFVDYDYTNYLINVNEALRDNHTKLKLKFYSFTDLHFSKATKLAELNFTEKFDGSFYKNFQKNKNYNKNRVNIFESSLQNVNSTIYENNILEEVEEHEKNLRLKTNNFPIKLIKGTLNKQNISTLNNSVELNKNIFLSYRLNNSDVTQKIAQVEQFWGFRQKRYKKLRSFVFSQNNKYSNTTYKYIGNFTNNENFNKYNLYTGVKNNKYRSESISSSVANRLLRTKRTLVLPAHINITLITNSYDVVHSWFVPGLGLKIDCVPGRSTHHTLYIDNVGFYYGQCAEICGRYHHHMPIRVCALSYEHFLLWWQTKGLPRMYRSKAFSQSKSLLLNKFK